ncbi:MAG TPA: class I lanthipeptide [Kofleriaceae bacterium]|nr:class I lanthipeptide [Kofleriaceae bacterium]
MNRSKHPRSSKLVLARETIHTLSARQLRHVVGGGSAVDQCTTGQATAGFESCTSTSGATATTNYQSCSVV